MDKIDKMVTVVKVIKTVVISINELRYSTTKNNVLPRLNRALWVVRGVRSVVSNDITVIRVNEARKTCVLTNRTTHLLIGLTARPGLAGGQTAGYLQFGLVLCGVRHIHHGGLCVSVHCTPQKQQKKKN